jgi:hypothetical protein
MTQVDNAQYCADVAVVPLQQVNRAKKDIDTLDQSV